MPDPVGGLFPPLPIPPGFTGPFAEPPNIDFLGGLNDPLGEFGELPFGESARDQIETLMALGLSQDAATELVRADMINQLTPRDTGTGASSALGFAQLAETQKNNAFNRVQDKLRLLMATDDLQESRRENVIFALLEAAPLMVAPGTEFSPGFEPGGPAMQLSNLIGANLQPQQLPTFELPLEEFQDAPTTVNPSLIEQQLGVLQ